ncbi:hypothetical protein [Yinghuangia seranimata]|uniref:hypothetical protein n=1 Tax=Yinghuangia seranimata TaxID=408067 RepID=UPI00248ADFDC|nr:hypothetical protein [Yinghuangia seranimata]MDI2124892.1 hypothetical protein [Yinghuangia seranimata]
MHTTLLHRTPDTADRRTALTADAVPRWAEAVAWATVVCTVPSGLWRVAAGFGVDVGFRGELGELYRGPQFIGYVWILTVLSQAAAMLTLGLVRPWGEVVPAWVPRIGGRVVPAWLVVAVASVGAVAVTALCAAVALAPHGPLENPDFPHGTAAKVMVACYAPLLAWGPMVLLLTTAYARRRARQAARERGL